MERARQAAWVAGINNKADWRKVPPDALRNASNIDVRSDGSLALRAGFEQAYAGTAVRGVLALGEELLIADGSDLVRFDSRTNTHLTLASIAGAGRLLGAELNGELFFCTENQTLRYRRGVLRRWGVPTVTAQPMPTVMSGGGLQPGLYQLAMTWVDAAGDEGGTVLPIRINVAAGQAVLVELPALAGMTPRLYVSAPNGSTLYLQAEHAGEHVISVVRDDQQRLETVLLREPSPANHIAAHNSVLALASGPVLWLTMPMRAHLLERARRFFQYPEDIGLVLSTKSGELVVSADKTYLLTDIESDTPGQAELFPYPAIPGTGVELDDGRVAWMTRYGLVGETKEGGISLLSHPGFVPEEIGAAGATELLERDGDQLVLTTLQRAPGKNPIAVSDHYEGEIVFP